jgi:riboflavin kinase/FMN adenylyltransferase
MLNGTVIKGKGLGKTIQFPTANLKIEEPYKLIPKKGVYLVQALIENESVFGMLNIGTNPTVSSANTLSIEVFFFNFNKNLYDTELRIQLLDRIRDEIKFTDLEALKTQLERDQQTAQTKIAHLTKN